MAELNNGCGGPGYLALKIDVLRVEPRKGMFQREQVFMNSDLDIVWLQVEYWLGERAFFQQEVLVHSQDLLDFCGGVEAIVDEELAPLPEGKDHMDRRADMLETTPELRLTLHQHTFHTTGLFPRVEKLVNYVTYSFRVMVETNVAAGEPVNDEGPGLLLRPDGEDLRAFARDLSSEVSIALLMR